MENFHGFNKNKSVEIDKLQEAIQFLEFEKSRLEGQFKQTCEINTELKKWYTQSVETKSVKTSLRNELLSKIDFYESSAERLDESIKKSERSLNFLKKNFDEIYASFKSTCEKYERKLNEKVEITQKGKISLANAFKSFQLTKSASHVLSITYEAAMIEERIENLERIKDNLCESIAKKKFNDHMKWWTEIKSDIIEMAKIMRALNEKEKEREKAKEKQESEQANFQSPKLNSEVVEIEVDKPEDNLNISRSSIVITPKSLNNKDVLISPENQKSENSKFSFDFGNFMASKKPGSNTSAESTFDFDAFISRRNESKFKMNNDLMKMFETPTKSSMKFDSSVESTSKPTNKSDTTTFNLF